MLFVGRRIIQPAVRTLSRDHVTTIKVEQQQVSDQQHGMEDISIVQQQEEQMQKDLKAMEPRPREKQSRKQQSKEQQSWEHQPRESQSREQQSKDQQLREQLSKEQQPREQLSKEQQPREQLSKEQQSKENQPGEHQSRDQQPRQNPKEQHQKREHQPMEEQPKEQQQPCEQQPGNEQPNEQQSSERQRAKLQSSLGSRPLGRQRSGRTVIAPEHALLETKSVEFRTPQFEPKGDHLAAVKVVVAPAVVDEPFAVQTEFAVQSAAEVDRRRQRQQREQFRKSNPELAGVSSLGSGRGAGYGSSLAVDRLTNSGGGRASSQLQLAVRHSSPVAAAVGTAVEKGNTTNPELKKTKLKFTTSINAMTSHGHVPDVETSRDGLVGLEAGLPIGGNKEWAGIEPESKTAAASDLDALAQITQDIVDAMAQKPAHGGHYKDLEDMLQVGWGGGAPTACILTSVQLACPECLAKCEFKEWANVDGTI